VVLYSSPRKHGTNNGHGNVLLVNGTPMGFRCLGTATTQGLIVAWDSARHVVGGPQPKEPAA
jgi:hypothetical protein